MNEYESIYSQSTTEHSRMVLLSSYVWHATSGKTPLNDTRALLRLQQDEQEKDFNSDIILIFTGVVHFTEAFNT